jgi:hypothetical protein
MLAVAFVNGVENPHACGSNLCDNLDQMNIAVSMRDLTRQQ